MVKNVRGIKKAVFVSGGTSGIGMALVKKYLQEGYFVIINFHTNSRKLSKIKSDLLKMGYEFRQHYYFLKADISNERILKKVLLQIPNKILDSVQVLINNAGIAKRGGILDLNPSDWVDVFKVNVFGIINLSKIFFEHAMNLRSIINIGSIRGEPAVSRIKNIAYSVSKSTIPTLTAAMAKSFGPRVTVNAVLPGIIDTPLRQGVPNNEAKLSGEDNTIIKRLGKPEEVADLCFFITSIHGSYITGSCFVIDGGYSINYIK